MEIYLREHARRSRVRVKLGDRVAGGGAGDIHQSKDCPGQVIKIYREVADRKVYHPKVEAMLASPPRISPLKHKGKERHQLAWPLYVAESKDGGFLGFSMPEIDFKNSVSLERMLQKRMRERSGLPEFYGYRLTVAYNLAASVAELHARDHHIIDLKPVNCRVYTDSMTLALLDCDGFSIFGDNKRFAAEQFTPEYIAPEAAGKSPSDLGVEQDLFALAVTIFRLLNNGLHPFQARLESGQIGGTLQEMIQAGHYPFGRSGSLICSPPKQSIHESFPDEIRKAFDQAFSRSNRPTAAKWRDILYQYADPASGKLVRCDVKPESHAHFGAGCGWCAMDTNMASSKTSKKPKSRTSPRTKARAKAAPPSSQIPLSQLSMFRSWWVFSVAIVSVIISLSTATVLTEPTDQTGKSEPTVFERHIEFETQPMNAEGFIIKNANLRRLPTTKSERITILKKGVEIQVLSKVEGRNWYFVRATKDQIGGSQELTEGYVYGELIAVLK